MLHVPDAAVHVLRRGAPSPGGGGQGVRVQPRRAGPGEGVEEGKVEEALQ